MNSTTVYTPLETLLLFQSLVAFGTEEDDFDRISDLLRNNALVKGAPTYNAQRLSSEALRSQYLQLLHDELKAEEQDGSEESSSKKRKIPSPPLPNLRDAREYRDKLPLLVDRLYARYREYMIQAIREDERRYEALQKEIDDIKKWDDEKVLKESGYRNGDFTAVQPQQSKTNGIPSEPVRPADIGEPPKPPTPRISPVPPLQKPNNIVLPSNQAPQSLPSPKIRPPPGFVPPPNVQRTPGAGAHGAQYGNIMWDPLTAPNQLPSYQPHPQNYSQHPGQYPSQNYNPPPRGSFQNPNGVSPHPPHHTVPSSPVHVQQQHAAFVSPQQGGIRRPPSSQGMDALADAASNQNRAPSGSPFQQSQPYHGPPHGSPQHLPQPFAPPHGQTYQGPATQGYPPPYPQQQRPPSSNGHPPYSQSSQYAPPFSPQPHYQGAQGQRPLPFQPPTQVQYSSPYNTGQPPRLSMQPTPAPRLPSNFPPSTPVSAGSARITITGLGTKWTPTPSIGTPRGNMQLPPPEVEKIPDADLVPKPIPSKSSTPTGSKPKRGRPKGSRGGGQVGSGSTRSTQETGAESVTSSVVAGSRRSQSIMSHADELSLDTEAADKSVKEEVATPIISEAGDTTADEVLPRHRPVPSRQTGKRKRAPTIINESRTPCGSPTQVLWTKNFPKISIPALENISAAKNASMFAKPLTEKEAPGYSELIVRPQDLKTIRSAITAGNKAALATASDEIKADSTKTSAWLPISEDLVPPKGIINYAQLEKELMRVFANAIMFNPDPDRGFGPKWTEAMASSTGGALGYAVDEDSVVKATRAMFADVEKTVGELRVAERRSEEKTRDSSVPQAAEDDEDELAGDGENHAAHTGSVAKRRRKA